MNITQYTNYYFLGIGGIGMSALARYFKHIEKEVQGYDKTVTQLTQTLENEGFEISYKDEEYAFPSHFLPENTLVVYTPAIPETSKLWQYIKNQKFTILKRSQVLGKITQQTKCLAIAGTHGKTTTTTLFAHLLQSCHFPVMSFLGGISENYQSNFLFQSDEFSVVEADEFDRSFLTLSPYFACITSTDADHLDIYKTDAHIKESFEAFAQKVSNEGKLFVKKGLNIQKEHLTYSVEEKADYYAHSLQQHILSTTFSLQTPTKNIENFEMHIHGKHNVENATVALAMALELGMCPQELKNALQTFKGIKRRFTTHSFSSKKVYIDDYAHHPTEIMAVYQAVQDLFPEQKKLVVFQPHLYSRTRDFAQDFAQSLSLFSEVILLDIYPARELPIAGITSAYLASLIQSNVAVSSLDKAIEKIFTKDFDVLITLGAGNIDTLSPQIIEKLHNYEA